MTYVSGVAEYPGGRCTRDGKMEHYFVVKDGNFVTMHRHRTKEAAETARAKLVGDRSVPTPEQDRALQYIMVGYASAACELEATGDLVVNAGSDTYIIKPNGDVEDA